MAWATNFDDFLNIPMTNNVHWSGQTSGMHGSFSIANPGNSVSETATIAELYSGMPPVTVVGIIIAKSESRHFPSKKDPTVERYVLTFTLRDSPDCFINVSCWGGEQHITCLANQFHIGHVVEVSSASVQSKPADGSDEKFKPWTPSLCQLIVNESPGAVKPYTEYTNDYLRYAHLPVKPHNDYYTISDIITNGQAMNGDIVNIMAVVKHVGRVRDMTAKTGRRLRKCEVKLFDDTSPSFTLILWDEELVNLAQTWEPKENVVFAADVRTTFDEFRKTMVATAIAKTIITVNPETHEAHALYQYAQNVDIMEIDLPATDDSYINVDLSQIQQMWKVCEIQQKLQSCRQPFNTSAADDLIVGITFACLTSFDIDSLSPSFVIKRCSQCRQRIAADADHCCNDSCSTAVMSYSSSMMQPCIAEASYDIRVTLSDHTASVPRCIIAGPVAEKMLGIMANDFVMLPEMKKTELKWRFLLERCKIYFRITTSTSSLSDAPRQSVLRVLDCMLANIDEVVRCL